MQLNLNKKKFLSEENVAQIVKIGINFAERLNSVESEIIADYDNTKTYLKGESCYHNNYIYRCKATATGDWDFSRWELIGDEITELTKDDIKDMLGLSDEELETLSKIILDSEVRLDKTYSSSKIYTDIQNAIDTAKAYTLTELGKISGASYKIASSTSDMTDEKVIYLLQNGSTYDMYIVEEDGTATKIGDTAINLDNYFTKTEITDNYYDKATCDGKFATITTVDGKVDKTSILSASSSTVTNEQVYSAFVMNNILRGKDNVAKVFSREINVDTFTENIKGWCGNLTGTTPNGLDVGWFENEYVNSTTINQKFISYTKVMYIRSMFGGTWSRWRKICTTSVADVPQTTITFTDTTNYKPESNHVDYGYRVLNGICYLQLCIRVVSVSSSPVIICDNLPKPLNGVRGTCASWTNNDSTSLCLKYGIYTEDSTLRVWDGVVGQAYLFRVSYPVAES